MKDAMTDREERVAAGIPPRAGAGLKGEHAREILGRRPPLGWFEAHAENYMVAGGPRHAFLEAVRALYPLSLHGVALSLGGAERPDRGHLAALRRLIGRYEPGLVSEHIAWSAHEGLYFADLLAPPLTAEALARLCDNIDEAQAALGRRLLIENPARYIRPPQAEIPEHEFMVEAARRTGCGLLVDVNNVYVSAGNIGFDAAAYLDALPAALVEEIHLAGHAVEGEGSRALRIDDHGSPVVDPVWALYDRLIARIGPRPTLIEWDNNIPAWDELAAEVGRAEARLARLRAPQGRAA
jgi:hypothetical protein